jgi:pyruvate/2-oxoglutarate dehydrogenase complex dihydrolipoamide acyltransferase (E2) component
MEHEVPLDDLAVAMAAIVEEEPAVAPVPQNEREEKAMEVEALLTTPLAVLAEEKAKAKQAAMAATEEKEKQAVVAAVPEPEASVAPRPPTEDVPMTTLVKAAVTENIVEKVASSVAIEPKLEPVAVLEVVQQKEEKVKVVKKKAAPRRKKVVKPKGPAASPLARLLAQELQLDLNNLGKGSGKNGKILIDDVRQFQARMEKAKESMTNNMGGAYFATARA